jgi:hypothetical protein
MRYLAAAFLQIELLGAQEDANNLRDQLLRPN